MPILAAGSDVACRRRSAEHGFTPVRRSAEHGFTLVELMVVVTILALAAGAVAWSLPDPSGRVRDEAARFALRVRAAHDEAIVGARPVSVWVTAGGYGFDARSGGGWQPLARPLAVERWQAGTQASLSDPAARVRVTFDPTGMADRPLELRLQRRAARAGVRIGGDGSVAVDG
jgi:general secretion pathway protein H